MSEQYYIDFATYTLDKLKMSLAGRDMIPSRVILKEKLDERFQQLSACGITNLSELIKALKSKDKIATFSKESGLSEEYLTILKREASSYQPNPIVLTKFPGVDMEACTKLAEIGIKNTKHMYTEAKIKSDMQTIIAKSGAKNSSVEELLGLSDLGRLYGVGPVFARMIYDTGVTSVAEFVKYSGDEFVELYEKQTNKKADFSSADINFSLEIARELLA